MVNLQQLMSPVRRAIDDFKMISAGDKIAVGLSGGKDSIAMLSALAGLKRFYPNPFEIVAIRIDTGIGYNEQEELALKTYVESLGVTYHVEKTEIYQVVFEERKEKNPCSLCANMRRGALNQTAKNLGCNKVCLGHHADDLIETFFLSMIYEGRLSTFQPVTYLSKADISVIRPMIYVKEYMIKSFCKDKPILKNPCPVDKFTQREEVKKTIEEMSIKYPLLKDNVFNALVNEDRHNLIKKP
ncbi:MAG: tRNA 2-thiocytidine(32) synthetase TtcA [Clostridiales bacterium]|nr:tRNA 2-thiocytidine(32) synthetase TtcA [Clostridiales bacterium]